MNCPWINKDYLSIYLSVYHACMHFWHESVMQLSMFNMHGTGGPRDRVGTLNVRAHPTWGILANFGHKRWPRDGEV